MKKRLGDLVKNIIAAAEESDEGLIEELLDDAKECGHEVDLLSSEDVTWEVSDGIRYATTRVDYSLKLGSKTIVEWSAEYYGEYGCGGTGWWISQLDTDKPDWVESLLEAAEIDIESPDVPEPESIDDSDDEGGSTSDKSFILQIIPCDFSVEAVYVDDHRGLFAAQRPDVVHFVEAIIKKREDGHYQTNISQDHIPRFLLAEAIHSQNEFYRLMREESNHGMPLATAECDELGLYSRGTGIFDVQGYETPSGLPKNLWQSDVEAYKISKAKVKYADGLYELPRSKSYTGKPVTSEARRLIEAIAFEREVSKKLNPRRFGIYSALCTWKDFCEDVIKPRSFFEELVDDQLIYDANGDDYGPFMDIAIHAQDTLLSKRIWGKGISVDKDEATNILQDGFSRLTSIQLAQFTLMNGMHATGLFLPLAKVLGLNPWETYIEWNTQCFQPDSAEEQSLRSETAIIKMLGDLANN
jgi:hypothetical protein